MAVRCFVPPASLIAGVLRLGGADFRYLARVRRLRVGDQLTLFDGEGREASARVSGVDEGVGEIVLSVAPPAEDVRPPGRLPLTLVCALLKGDKMDLVVQKATELGATRVCPVTAAHSVARLESGRAANRVARWQKIAREAARQCGRADAPEIAAPAALVETLVAVPATALRLFFHEGPATRPLFEALPEAPPAGLAVAVGPEGGFAPDELAAAVAAGWQPVRIGTRVLRAETAAIAALAVVGYALGDLGESGI